jgi:hypothetical protein
LSEVSRLESGFEFETGAMLLVEERGSGVFGALLGVEDDLDPSPLACVGGNLIVHCASTQICELQSVEVIIIHWGERSK